MFPPGRGNDTPNVGQKYVISIYGTNEVLTAEGVEVRLGEYQKDDSLQIWICIQNENGQIGMQNESTKRFLGRRNLWSHFGCAVEIQKCWESLYFTPLSLGGYSMLVINGVGIMWHGVTDRGLHPVQREGGGRPGLMIGERIERFGLHQLEDSVIRRFQWVVPNRLARSSAPYYDSEDSDQNMNETSIKFLAKHGINRIISLNKIPLSVRERRKLNDARISYTHVEVPDFAAPTKSQFDQIRNAYAKGGVTLIYCGYGDGRTGMAISALQLFEGRELSHKDYRDHGVQSPNQLTALDELSIRIHRPSVPGAEPPPYAASDASESVRSMQ
ncbi:hypothetical protein L873DRAFT_1814049 [Choiromyces venosus 120613-1]|uniref:Swiss Army Knife protein DSP-PTPase phosphatase domain-containing protein n=1 Tax=Choiromyces venosus 120613-1 TaxID=1336337 RepID=A0A3N4JB53_9PEZI|nr:hypothetical protein L873DRAFT_1814049 [Choiromyces venosus 120613-1]